MVRAWIFRIFRSFRRIIRDSGNSGASGASGNSGTSGTSGDSGASASILSPIFVVFRGRITGAPRLAARRAEPSFLLAGAVISRVRRLCGKTENRQKSVKNRRKTATMQLRSRASREKRVFSFLDAACHRFWLPWRAPGCSPTLFLASQDRFADSQGAPGARRGRPKTLQRHSRNTLGCHGVCPEGPGIDFDSILGALEPLLGSILNRFLEKIR